MEILYANILCYLIRYAQFIKIFFKNKVLKYFVDVCKYFIIAYSLYLVKGYMGSICYIFIPAIIFIEDFLKEKNIILRFIISFIVGFILFFSKDYSYLSILIYIAFVTHSLLEQFPKKNSVITYMEYISNILICVYSFNYNLYILFIYKVFDISFPIVSKYLKKTVNHINKKIS